MVLDGGVAFFGNEIEIRLRGDGQEGLGLISDAVSIDLHLVSAKEC